ncbi:jg3553, partial [Pararge aegeria aegeria]
ARLPAAATLTSFLHLRGAACDLDPESASQAQCHYLHNNCAPSVESAERVNKSLLKRQIRKKRFSFHDSLIV